MHVSASKVEPAVAHTDENDARDRFAALFTANSRPLLAYALRRTSPTDAGDVVAETMLIAWRRLDELPRGGERLWLYGVARRVLANELRAARRRERLGARFSDEAVRATSVHRDGSVADLLAIGDAVRRLAAAEREVVELAAWEGLTPAEIAVVLGVPSATVRSRLHRARQELHGRLDDPTGPAPRPRTAPSMEDDR
jgi:RNA polymerase sigma-70 factor (ECF subfamily)